MKDLTRAETAIVNALWKLHDHYNNHMAPVAIKEIREGAGLSKGEFDAAIISLARQDIVKLTTTTANMA